MITHQQTEVAEVPLVVLDGEPRALDLDIAGRLGFAKPLMIRKLIERHALSLAQFGVISTVEKTSGRQGGRPATEYWLNEPQALFIASKSDAELADVVLTMLIRVFTAWRRGHLTGHVDFDTSARNMLGGLIKRNAGVVIREALSPIEASLLATTQRLSQLEERIQAATTCTALDMWREFQLPPCKGGTLWLGNRLIDLGCSPEFGSRARAGSNWKRLFDAGRARTAMQNGLLLLARRHVIERQGQGRLKLVARE